MKFSENNPRLEIVDFDWWWGVGSILSFLFMLWAVYSNSIGFPLAIVPISVWAGFCGSFLWLSTRSRFVFDGEERTVHWSRFGYFGRRKGTFDFSEIKAVGLKMDFPGWNAPTQRIYVITDRPIAIQTGFSIDEKLNRTLARKIKAMVATKQPRVANRAAG